MPDGPRCYSCCLLAAQLHRHSYLDHALLQTARHRSRCSGKLGRMDLDEVSFILDEAGFQQFTDLLDEPMAPNAGLLRLMAVQPPWAKDDLALSPEG